MKELDWLFHMPVAIKSPACHVKVCLASCIPGKLPWPLTRFPNTVKKITRLKSCRPSANKSGLDAHPPLHLIAPAGGFHAMFHHLIDDNHVKLILGQAANIALCKFDLKICWQKNMLMVVWKNMSNSLGLMSKSTSRYIFKSRRVMHWCGGGERAQRHRRLRIMIPLQPGIPLPWRHSSKGLQRPRWPPILTHLPPTFWPDAVEPSAVQAFILAVGSRRSGGGGSEDNR
jgi:hypothetical protein